MVILFQAHQIYYFSHSGWVFDILNVFPIKSQNVIFGNFISEHKLVYDTEENYLNAVHLNAYTGLFLFASVYKPHNSTKSQWKAALSGPQHTPSNWKVITVDDYEIQSDMDDHKTGKPLETWHVHRQSNLQHSNGTIMRG
jgi:hypothetical protein